MPTEKEQVEAREDDAPEPAEETPRGNIHSETDESEPGEMPPPLPN